MLADLPYQTVGEYTAASSIERDRMGFKGHFVIFPEGSGAESETQARPEAGGWFRYLPGAEMSEAANQAMLLTVAGMHPVIKAIWENGRLPTASLDVVAKELIKGAACQFVSNRKIDGCETLLVAGEEKPGKGVQLITDSQPFEKAFALYSNMYPDPLKVLLRRTPRIYQADISYYPLHPEEKLGRSAALCQSLLQLVNLTASAVVLGTSQILALGREEPVAGVARLQSGIYRTFTEFGLNLQSPLETSVLS